MARNRKQEGLESVFRGKSKELWAAGMFNGWLWTTARPDPDIGADLVVEIPSHCDEIGASFAIQCRSHKNRIRTETIKRASALRLQGSVLPTFLLSIHNGSGQVRWMYLEPLFDTEPNYLGGGSLKVHMVDTQSFALTDSVPPADFVAAIYHAKARGGLKATPSLKAHAAATEQRYREIDPNLVVKPSYAKGREVISIGARDKPVNVQIRMELTTSRDKLSVREAFEWGAKACISGSNFVISGSPFFEHIQKVSSVTDMTFVPEPLWEGSGVLTYHDASEKLRTMVVDVRAGSRTNTSCIIGQHC